MPVCNIDGCKEEAKGSWLDQDRLIMTFCCEKHFIQYHEKPASVLDKVVKPEILPFRTNRNMPW